MKRAGIFCDELGVGLTEEATWMKRHDPMYPGRWLVDMPWGVCKWLGLSVDESYTAAVMDDFGDLVRVPA